MAVAAIVLAAGASRRLGERKQLAMLGGERLLERAVRVASEAGLAPVIVVLGAHAQEIAAACDLRGAHVVIHAGWAEGMGSSVRAGVEALRDVGGVVLMTCDQPGVTANHLRELVQEGQARHGAVASLYTGDRDREEEPRGERVGRGGNRGVPAYLPDTRFEELLLLRGDTGAKGLLASATSIRLELGELDVDTPEALARARSIFGAGKPGSGA